MSCPPVYAYVHVVCKARDGLFLELVMRASQESGRCNYLVVRSTFSWLQNCSYSVLLKSESRTSWGRTGFEVESYPSYKCHGPPSRARQKLDSQGRHLAKEVSLCDGAPSRADKRKVLGFGQLRRPSCLYSRFLGCRQHGYYIGTREQEPTMCLQLI